MTKPHYLAALAAALALAGCQSGQTSTAGAMATASAPSATSASAGAGTQSAFAATASAPGGQCSITLAGGPPPKPAKGADFAKNAIGNNIKRNVTRNLISNIGARVAGPLGGAVAQGIATDRIRTEQDLKGIWTITDGRSDCGCAVDISSGVNLQMKSSNAGALTTRGCANVQLAQAARWSLGHSFTGYDAPLTVMAPDRRTVVATLNRDGLNYFSGTLADGSAVTMWRRGG
ncbi:hypothetical protein DFR52_103689 [Hoeflea marina]|uniref:Protease inhibitor Inh n=1 Tax=Hoeflea marina TaxID=274592 RepID=A0A317PJ33_9HYPH|nr:hypothetical protein [Hoeflea marina]PWW00482.1 hypothetical protein DFR52_103689 [Hoeflea marina]